HKFSGAASRCLNDGEIEPLSCKTLSSPLSLSQLSSLTLSAVTPSAGLSHSLSCKTLSSLQKGLLVPTCPPSRTFITSEPGNRQGKSLQTPHTLDTNYSNSSPLVDATDHCSPKPPDTKTVSSPSRLTTEQLTHCSIYIYIYIFIPALLALSTSSLHYCFTATVYSHSALCIYFLKLSRPLHCCTVCFVLYCVVMYILCKHTESHFTKSNSLFVQTYLANKT